MEHTLFLDIINRIAFIANYKISNIENNITKNLPDKLRYLIDITSKNRESNDEEFIKILHQETDINFIANNKKEYIFTIKQSDTTLNDPPVYVYDNKSEIYSQCLSHFLISEFSYFCYKIANYKFLHHKKGMRIIKYLKSEFVNIYIDEFLNDILFVNDCNYALYFKDEQIIYIVSHKQNKLIETLKHLQIYDDQEFSKQKNDINNKVCLIIKDQKSEVDYILNTQDTTESFLEKQLYNLIDYLQSDDNYEKLLQTVSLEITKAAYEEEYFEKDVIKLKNDISIEKIICYKDFYIIEFNSENIFPSESITTQLNLDFIIEDISIN